MRGLGTMLRLGDVNSTPGVEWAWAVGRLAVSGLVLLGALVLLEDRPGGDLFPVVVAAVYAYGALAIVLLLQRRVRAAFLLGFTCDTVIVIVTMVLFMRGEAGAQQTNDLYLALFPIVALGVARLGCVFGTLYTLLWMGVLSWGTLTYYSPTSYDVQQLPVRLLFLAATALLVMRLVVLVQRERRQEEQRAEAAAQMERLKSALLHSVSHQLKTPLTAVQSASDLLTSGEAELTAEQHNRAARLLQSGVQRLRTIVQASLDYANLASAPGTLQTKDVDLTNAASAVIRGLEETARAKEQTVLLKTADSLPLVQADPRHVRDMLQSLLENAQKFTPSGGRIEVLLGSRGDRVQVEVMDTGPGVPAETREGLFHLFYRGHSPDMTSEAGTGSGLAVTKLLVELYGGSIGYRAAPEGGATFFFTLPAVKAAQAARDPSTASAIRRLAS